MIIILLFQVCREDDSNLQWKNIIWFMLSTSAPHLVAIQEEELAMHIIMKQNWKSDFLIIKNPAKTEFWKGCKPKTATGTKPKNRIKSNNRKTDQTSDQNRKTHDPDALCSFYGGKEE